MTTLFNSLVSVVVMNVSKYSFCGCWWCCCCCSSSWSIVGFCSSINDKLEEEDEEEVELGCCTTKGEGEEDE
jgi:hypothetical protein